MTTSKYDPQARDWSERAYADASTYLAHRADLVLGLGPRLEPGDSVLDLACGDGGLGDFLEGVAYTGVDASAPMVDEARERGRNVVLGDLNDYEPSAPVTATTCFRAIYYARDRPAFFRRVAGYTERKFVFDLNPRQYRLEEVRAELRDAGWSRLDVRPFFVPQTRALPPPVALALRAAEQAGPIARLLLRLRFTYVCAAAR